MTLHVPYYKSSRLSGCWWRWLARDRGTPRQANVLPGDRSQHKGPGRGIRAGLREALGIMRELQPRAAGILQRLPEHGGGTTKRDRLSWIIGALFRMVYGYLTPTDVALSVCKLAVELELSGTSSPMSLLRVALLRVGVIILERQEEERTKEFSGTFNSLAK